ncbi:MAG: hypothetical protein M1813_004473 [Trichoglossum hirsutum]|jgi:hypothetical protein|nr:MAG: hypothetical protein M1813_004473 [Trichoglossum hirsutum]
MTEQEKDHIWNCVETVATSIPCSFILIGGASMVRLHSNRSTNDVDVLVPPHTNIHQLVLQLAGCNNFRLEGGILYIEPSSSSPSQATRIKLDILIEVLGVVTFSDLIGYTVNTDGITMLTLPVSLGVKLKCWYSRAEDENGMKKKDLDIEDILFLARKMQDCKIRVDDNIPVGLKISHYNLLLVRLRISKDEIQLLYAVGCSKFLKPYSDNTLDQKELYEFMGAGANTDPLTVELEDEEE